MKPKPPRALRAVLGDRPIAYHPILARVAGSVPAGILLGQLLYWDSVMSTARGATWEGWFYKSSKEINQETALGRYAQDCAREELRARGLIETKLRGVPATTHYKIDFDALEHAIEALDEQCEDASNDRFQNRTSSLQTVDKLDCRPSTNQFAESEQTTLQTVDKLDRAPSANLFADSLQTIQENTHPISAEEKQETDVLPAEKIWASAQKELAASLDRTTFRNLIEPLKLQTYTNGAGPPTLTLSVPSTRELQWIEFRYRPMIESAVERAATKPVAVEFVSTN